MVTRGGTNNFSGRAYSYFRDDAFNARGHFLPPTSPKPDERTLQAGIGLGGPIVRDRAHFYFTYEKDNEDIAGQKRFPPLAAPLAQDMIGAFTVRATNYFARGDLQINEKNFFNLRWVLETAPTRGEGFNTNNQTIDAQTWESDWDHLISGSYTTVVGDRGSNVIRVGRIGEELATGAQAFFDDDVNFIGFAGRDPFSIGQSNTHPGFVTGKGGSMVRTRIRTYVFDDSYSYFMPSLWGGEHTFKMGGGVSYNQMPPRTTVDSGTFMFRTDAPYNPANPATHPFQFDVIVGAFPGIAAKAAVIVGPPNVEGYDVFSRDRRYYFFVEDKYRVSNNVTLNLGLRYDNQRQTPNANTAFAPRAGLAWDVTGSGKTVVRGGVGKFYAYPPVVLDLTLQQNNVLTKFPTISINSANDPNGVILRPDVGTDSQGNLGVAFLSPAGQAELNRQRDQIIAGGAYNRNPWVDSDTRQLPYTVSWSLGVSHQLLANSAVSVDYVANASRDQLGVIDINEPVNRVRPGVNVFDPTGELIPPQARATPFARVLQVQTNPLFDGDYKSLQFSFNKRMSSRWSMAAALCPLEPCPLANGCAGG